MRIVSPIVLGVVGPIMLTGLAAAQTAPTAGLVGNYYESYTGPISCGPGAGLGCRNAFPQNTTGKRILVTDVTCRIVASGARPDLLGFGIATTQGGALTKQTFFDVASNVQEGSSWVVVAGGKPDIIVGPDRFPIITVGTADPAVTNLQCNLSGQVVP